MANESLSLQKLLCKILNKSIVDKFHNELQKNSINHNKLSTDAGKHPSAFNKTFNNVEQLTLTSFLRYWYVASTMTSSSLNFGPFSLDNFIQDEELHILRLLCSIKDSSVDYLESADIQLLKHLKYHFDFLQKNNKLSKEEIEVYNKIFNKDVVL
jgi:hypothetical protein